MEEVAGVHYWRPLWSPQGDHIYFVSYRGSGINIWRVAVNASGKATEEPEAATSGAGHDLQPCFAHNGKRLAYSIQRLNSDISRLPVDPARGRPTGREEPLVETVKEDSRGSWSPDMKFVAFNWDRQDGNMNLWIHNLATGEEERITSGRSGDYQAQWTPDGKSLVFFSGRSENGSSHNVFEFPDPNDKIDFPTPK